MGKIIAYSREQCPHSISTSQVLSKLKDKYNIDIKYVKNDETEKNKVKNQLKEIIGNHNTFPIVIYKTSKDRYYLVGGNTDLQNIIKLSQQVNSKEDIMELDLNVIHRRVIYYLFKNRD
jgi:glutaredoxin